jgi:hypothetical protein
MAFTTTAQSRNALKGFCALVLAQCGLGVLIAASLCADEPPAKPPARSLDAQLLDGLDADLLKDLPGAKPAGPPQPGQTAAPSTATNPLAIVGDRMREVQRRIAGRDTSAETQSVQKQIESDLAKLIEQARQQCAACNKAGSGHGQQAAGTGGDPTTAPPRDSTHRIERGTKEAVETADVQDVLRRFWGHLPDKIREQLHSSLSEEFLPKYERVIEDYYKRLAEDPRGSP